MAITFSPTRHWPGFLIAISKSTNANSNAELIIELKKEPESPGIGDPSLQYPEHIACHTAAPLPDTVAESTESRHNAVHLKLYPITTC